MRALSILLVVAGIAVGAATAYLAIGLSAGSRRSLDPVEGFASGPPVGSQLPGPFDPLHVNGPQAGEESCVYCQYGDRPVAMVFASRPGGGLAELVRGLEHAAAGAPGEVGACVVITDTSEGTRRELGALAEKNQLQHVVLAVIDPAHLKHYKLDPEAEATVLLYRKHVVRVNRAFRAGELNATTAAEVAGQAVKLFTGE